MSEQPTITVSAYADTDVGRVRENNEDNFLILDLNGGAVRIATDESDPLDDVMHLTVGEAGFLSAVSDGMGGALAGEVASSLAVKIVSQLMQKFQESPDYAQWPFSERFRLAIEQANLFIHEQSQTSPRFAGMGATFTGIAVHQETMYLAQVGDSRAYIIRDGRIRQATKDQSLVGQLVDAGYLTEEQAQQHVYRNVILQALGAQPDTTVVLDRFALCQNDIVLLCSDGLSNKVQADEMLAILSSASDLKQGCQQLISLANERGGDDNITVAVCHFKGEGLLELTDDTEFNLVRIEREERLPASIGPDLLDGDALLAHWLEKDDALPRNPGPAPPPTPMTWDDHEKEVPDANPSLEPLPSPSVAEGRWLEQHISRILIIILALIFLGAIIVSLWYLKLQKNQNPQPENFSPQTVFVPKIPSVISV